MGKLENRQIIIEDWKGNRYYPMNNPDGTTSGIISKKASNTEGADPYTDANPVYTTDNDASEGKAIVIEADPNTDKVLYRATFPSIKFGQLSVGVRLKSSTASGDTALVNVKASIIDTSPAIPKVATLDTYNIAAKDFKTASKYSTFIKAIEYAPTNSVGSANGKTSFAIEITVLHGTGATISFDYMFVALDTTTASGASRREVYVDTANQTVVVGE